MHIRNLETNAEPGVISAFGGGADIRLCSPKDVSISVEQKAPGNLEPEAWATLRRVLDLMEACKVEGNSQAVFAAIEEDLRARIAVPVEFK
jgi:hypothetical protein